MTTMPITRTTPDDTTRGVRVRRRLGLVRSPRLLPVLLGLSGLACLGVLLLTSYTNFFSDEWGLITNDRPWQPNLLLAPHNQQWSTMPILLWKVLFVLVGIRSHLPYEATLLVVHGVTVFLLFTLIRRRSGDLPAFAAALILLVLGSGATNIVWAFQVGFVGSTAFGLLAMVLLDRDRGQPWRLALGSAALLCSLMCSEVGLAFVVAALMEWSFDAGRRSYLAALAIPIAAFGVWSAAFGLGLPISGPTSLTSLLNLAGFVIWGLGASVGGVFGFLGIGAGLLPIAAALVAWHWYRQWPIESWQIGLIVGMVGWFTLVGLRLSQKGPAVAGDPRFVYVGVVFLLPVLADAISELPWRRMWRPALGTIFVLSLLGNTLQLWDIARSKTELMRVENAELQTVEVFRSAPDMALNRPVDGQIMPQLNAGPYLAAIQDLGSPVPSASVSTLEELPIAPVDQVMVNLFGGAMTVTPDISRSLQGFQCQSVDSSAGSTMDFQAIAGQSFLLQSSTGGDAFVFLGFRSPPTSQPLMHFQLLPATPERVHIPDTGKPTIWQLRISTADVGLLQVCGAPSMTVNQSFKVYLGSAANGRLDPGWESLADTAALYGRAAEATHGTFPSYRVDVFGAPVVPASTRFDVWYRVRVKDPAGAIPEMTLGLWDDQAGNWVGSTIYRADQIGTAYSWVKVASAVTPAPGHSVHFLAFFTLRLGTDWVVDSAVMVPTAPPL